MRLAREILVYGTGDALVRGAALITVPIYTRLFPPAEYGVLAYMFALSGLAAVFVGLGGDSAYSRYFFDAEDDEGRRVLTSTWLAFLALWSGVLVMPVVLWRDELSLTLLGTVEHGAALALAFAALPFVLMNLICGQVLRNRFHAGAFVGLNLVTVALTVGLGLAAVLAFGMGVGGILLGILLAGAAMLPLRLWSVRDLIARRFSAGLLRKLLSFGVPLMIAAGAYWVLTMSDRLLLQRLVGLTEVGIYSVAVTLSMIVNLALNALGQAWSPHFLSIYRGRPQAAPRVAADFGLCVIAAFGLLSVTLAVFAGELVGLLSGDGYRAATVAVLPLALAVSANAAAQVTAVGISVTKRTHFMAWLSWAAALLNVALNLVLIPPYGIAGAAWATAISFGLLSLSYGVISQRLWPVPFDLLRLSLLCGLTLMAGLAAMWLPGGLSWPALPLKLLYLLVVAGLMLLACGREFIRNIPELFERPPQAVSAA